MTKTYSQSVMVCVYNRNLLLSFRSGSVDLEPLPSPADSSAPANHRGSSELGSHSKLVR